MIYFTEPLLCRVLIINRTLSTSLNSHPLTSHHLIVASSTSKILLLYDGLRSA